MKVQPMCRIMRGVEKQDSGRVPSAGFGAPRSFLPGLVAILLVGCQPAVVTTVPLSPPVVLTDEAGRSAFVIVSRSNAPENAVFAARELQTYIEKTTGTRLEIAAAVPPGRKGVYVGEHPDLPQEPRFNPATYAAEEKFRIDEWNGNLVIMGATTDSTQRDILTEEVGNFGLLYGTYDFIERFLGTRWYAPGELGECLDPRLAVRVSGLPVEETALYHRRSFWPFNFNEANREESALWYRRLKGIGTSELNINHSMLGFSLEFKDRYPEIFALTVNGNRVFGSYNEQAKRWENYPHYCFNNPKFLELYLQMIDEGYQGTERARRIWGDMHPTDDYIYVVPNDNFVAGNSCWCPECQAQRDPARGSRGFNSDLVFGFVKKVADAVKLKYPDKQVAALAYEGYYLPPQRVKLPDNVVVRLCLDPYVIYFGQAEFARESVAFIADWAKVVSEISIWHYYLPYKDIPYFMPHRLYDWYLANAGLIKTSFIELNDSWFRPQPKDPRWGEQVVNTDLPQSNLNVFFSMKAQWGSRIHVDDELERYYRLFFGPACAPMKRFYDLAIERWENVPTSPEAPASKTSGNLFYGVIYPPAVVTALQEALAEARQAAPPDSIYARRVAWVGGYFFEAFVKVATAFHRQSADSCLLIPPATAPIQVDGVLDEPAWGGAPIYRMLQTDGPMPPRFPTHFRALVRDHTLYLGIEADDPAVAARTLMAQERDAMVWEDDSIELFLTPDPARPEHYFQVVVNLAGVVFDREVGGAGDGIKWNSAGVSQTAFGQDRWTLELALPLRELGIADLAPGTLWRFNLCRNKRSGPSDLHESSQWVPTVRNYNSPHEFGKAILADTPFLMEDFEGNGDGYRLGYHQVEPAPEGERVVAGQEVRNQVIAEEGILNWTIHFSENLLEKDYASISFAPTLARMTAPPAAWCEVRFRNDPEVTLLVSYSYLGEDGRNYNDYFLLTDNDASAKLRTRAFRFAEDGLEATSQARNGTPARPKPTQLTYLAVHAVCLSPSGTEPTKTVGLDYLRITDQPVVNAGK
jgi:hypothetical protein